MPDTYVHTHIYSLSFFPHLSYTRTHLGTGVSGNLHELTKKHIHSYIQTLDSQDLAIHTFTPTLPLSLSQCSMEQLLKAVGSQLLTSHLIIPLDRHEILSFSLSVSLSVSFALALIFLFLLCFYLFSYFLHFSNFVLLCLIFFSLYSSLCLSFSYLFFSCVGPIFVFTGKLKLLLTLRLIRHLI